MSIVWSGLAPHPPIIVPEIGQERLNEAIQTVEAVRQLAADFKDHGCEQLIVLSPHTPRPNRGVSLFCDPMITGHFGTFGHFHLKYHFLNDIEWIREFARYYSRVSLIENQSLDHGALVPLHFFKEAGWDGPTVVLGLPWDEAELASIAGAIQRCSSKKTGLLASGDMSHCLRSDAPSGFHPDGRKFDKLFVKLLKKAAYKEIQSATRELRTHAAEDVFMSCQVAFEATEYRNRSCKFLSYESPFGVGYSVSRLFSEHANS